MRLRVGPDISERFDKLAALLRHQPFEDETEQKFKAKWEQLVNEYEALYPDAIPPLLEYADNEWTTKVRWPKGWSK